MIDMWMAEYQFVGQFAAHIAHVEITLLAGNLGIKADMQQHVAQFLAYIGQVIVQQGVTQFVCLFDGVWSERLKCLLLVPRAFGSQLVQYI